MGSYFKFFFSMVFVISSFFGLALYLNQQGFFNLTQVNLLVDQSDIQAVRMKTNIISLQKKLESIKGQALHEIKLNQIKIHLDRENWISSYQISRRWPSQLDVLIKPEKIYFSILDQDGEFRHVIQSGELLSAAKISSAVDVPLARQSEFLQNHELRKRAIQLLKDIPLSGAFSRSEVSEIEFDEKEGFTLFMARDHLRVKLGEKEVRNKSLQVTQVMHYLANKKIQARVIDANLSQKVLVRLRKAP